MWRLNLPIVIGGVVIRVLYQQGPNGIEMLAGSRCHSQLINLATVYAIPVSTWSNLARLQWTSASFGYLAIFWLGYDSAFLKFLSTFFYLGINHEFKESLWSTNASRASIIVFIRAYRSPSTFAPRPSRKKITSIISIKEIFKKPSRYGKNLGGFQISHCRAHLIWSPQVSRSQSTVVGREIRLWRHIEVCDLEMTFYENGFRPVSSFLIRSHRNPTGPTEQRSLENMNLYIFVIFSGETAITHVFIGIRATKDW